MTLSVTNHLKSQTSIHWHGIRAPADMDGVPGLSFPGIAPAKLSSIAYRSANPERTGITAIAASRTSNP